MGQQWATAQFFFGPNGEHVVEMSIKQLQANKKVVWKCTAGPWAETDEFIFTISEHERGSVVDFANTGWAASDEFFRHCNSKWGFFLTVSLKSYLETGTGQPHPNDPNI